LAPSDEGAATARWLGEGILGITPSGALRHLPHLREA